MKLSVNARRVSPGRISRRIFVAHRMGKFPGIKETRDARAEVLAGAVGGGTQHSDTPQRSAQSALVRVPC